MTYCVYLTVYRGTRLPSRYIGSTTAKRVRDGYNGSVKSKDFKQVYEEEQRLNKHLFRTRILMTFATQLEAVEAELKLQLKHNVIRSEKYMNRSYAKPNGFLVEISLALNIHFLDVNILNLPKRKLRARLGRSLNLAKYHHHLLP